jgi:hypothetical protein
MLLRSPRSLQVKQPEYSVTFLSIFRMMCRSILNANIIPASSARANWLRRRSLNITHIHGTHVPVVEPSTASKPDVAVGVDEKKRVGDMCQVIAHVGAWKLGPEGARKSSNLKRLTGARTARSAFFPDREARHPGAHAEWDTWPRFRTVCAASRFPTRRDPRRNCRAGEGLQPWRSGLRQLHPHFDMRGIA